MAEKYGKNPEGLGYGSLKARARRKGQGKSAFAKSNIHADSPVGKLARLEYIRQGTHGGGKSNMSGPGDVRDSKSKLYQIG